MDFFRRMLSYNDIKEICSRAKHANYTLNENQFNLILSIQSHLLYSFIHCGLKSDMKCIDFIDSMNIEYNHPFSRDRIRKYNRTVHIGGVYFIKTMDIVGFCFKTLECHFPSISGIWAWTEHEAHVHVLEMVKLCFEYGFFEHKHVAKLADLMKKVCLK